MSASSCQKDSEDSKPKDILKQKEDSLKFWVTVARRDNFGIPAMLHYYLMADKNEGDSRLKLFLRKFDNISLDYNDNSNEAIKRRVIRGFGEKGLIDYFITLLSYGSYQ